MVILTFDRASSGLRGERMKCPGLNRPDWWSGPLVRCLARPSSL